MSDHPQGNNDDTPSSVLKTDNVKLRLAQTNTLNLSNLSTLHLIRQKALELAIEFQSKVETDDKQVVEVAKTFEKYFHIGE